MITYITHFDTPPAPPTIADILAALTGPQKVAILNAWVNEESVPQALISTGQPMEVLRILYFGLIAIQAKARQYMRGEVEVTPAVPAVLDPQTGEVVVPEVPAVYNTPPTSATALKSAIGNEFNEQFTLAEVGAVINKIIEYSKRDGSGDWTFYSTNIVL